MAFIIKKYNQSKNFKGIDSASPFQMQMSLPVPDHFALVDCNIGNNGYSNYLNSKPSNLLHDMMTKAQRGIKIGDI